LLSLCDFLPWLSGSTGKPRLPRILQRGNRLSITPIEPEEWRDIVEGLLAGD